MLPEPVHDRLITEFRFAAERMHEVDDLRQKLYFFSVFHGETGRQLNIHWDPDLALLNVVAQALAQGLPNQPRIPIIPEGKTPTEFILALDYIAEELLAAFESPSINRERFYAAVTKMAELLYSATGNGFYLYMKGMIQLVPPGRRPLLGESSADSFVVQHESGPSSGSSRRRPRQRL